MVDPSQNALRVEVALGREGESSGPRTAQNPNQPPTDANGAMRKVYGVSVELRSRPLAESLVMTTTPAIAPLGEASLLEGLPFRVHARQVLRIREQDQFRPNEIYADFEKPNAKVRVPSPIAWGSGVHQQCVT